MGQFIYGGAASSAYTIDDRTLAHLEVAIATEFWMHPAIWMEFRIDDPAVTRPLNPAWIAAMVALASSDRGLSLIREPQHSE